MIEEMRKKAKVLIVEDNKSLAAIYSSSLRGENLDVLVVEDTKSAREAWERAQPDLVLLDVQLPDGSGLDLLRDRPREESAASVVVMTAFGSAVSAAEAINLGAVDYLAKPFNAKRLKVTVLNTLKSRELENTVRDYGALERQRYCGFIGRSQPLQAVYRIIDSVATSDATAFIVGESGTGKELAASALHQMSKRANKPFHAINCGAIPSELIESELFGHVKGAFTDAAGRRDGAASAADGGTLFLDEICEMDLELQKKILRFVQTGEFQRVGSNSVERTDIRIVCATNRDPKEEVKEGRFREDLFYRLHVVPIHLPPLRDMGEDIIDIADSYLHFYSQRDDKSFTRVSDDAKASMLAYTWPGNIRELQNVIQRAVVLHDGEILTSDMLQLGEASVIGCNDLCADDHQAQSPITNPVETAVLSTTLTVEPWWLTEKRAIEEAIEACGGNIPEAATLLEVASSTLYRKLQIWEERARRDRIRYRAA